MTQKSKKGFALVFAILLMVGLQATIAGSFVNMMRHEREVSRVVHQTQADWVREATIDRTMKLFADYIQTMKKFPEVTADKIVIGDDAQKVTGGKPFSNFLIQNWYPAPTNGLQSRFPDPLGQIELSSVVIKEIETLALQRRYDVTVTIKHLTTQVTSTATQSLLIERGQIFDFAVFYNEDLEIIPGPNMTLQGPVFSNKNVYLMTDIGRTLNLVRADDYSVSDNPQKYVLHSAGNIYFYFKRLMGKNYMLENNAYKSALATGGIPAIYATDNSSVYPPADGAELYSTTYNPNATDGRESPMFPLFYYAENGAKLGNASGTAVASDNTIYAENESGSLVGLTPSHAILQQMCANLSANNGAWLILCRSYTPTYDTQPSGSKMNTSSAFAPGSLPRLDLGWIVADPISSNPERNLNWWGDNEAASPVGRNMLDLQPEQTISIGDPNQDDHLIIEPLTSTFPPGSLGTRATESDTEDVADLKFQSQSDINLFCMESCTRADYSPDLLNLVGAGVVTISSGFQDSRIGVGNRTTLTVDLEKLFMTMNGDGKIVYIHLYPLTAGTNYPTIARLVNGKKLPQGGFTVATNGRLWIQGDYNTFDYSKNNGVGANCTPIEWDNKDCQVPPAAVFSDSVGVLSNEWQDDPAYNRQVQNNVMVNVAVATGTLPSLLKERYPSCKTDLNGCEQQFPFPDGQFNWFSCPADASGNRLNSDGTPINPATCEYYRGSGLQCQYDPVSCPYPGKEGVYYLNKLSSLYRRATTYCTEAGQTNCVTVDGDGWTAGVQPGRDDRLLNWNEIPIVADASRTDQFRTLNSVAQQYGQRGTTNLEVPDDPSAASEPPGMRKFPGLHYAVLYKEYLYETTGTVSSGRCLGTPTQCGPSLVCPVGQACDGVDQEDSTYECLSWECPMCPAGYTSANYPCWVWDSTTPGAARRSRIFYWPARYPTIPLYEAKYSGGLENLINLQESWTTSKTLRFSGVLSALWKSLELYDNGTGEPAYYGAGYYIAPERKFDYDESLRTNPPPATPGVFSIQRKSWRRG